VPVFSELTNISVPLASVRPQVAPILTQLSTFSAINMPVLGHDNTARKTNHPGK
jgi:hypothetical protein